MLRTILAATVLIATHFCWAANVDERLPAPKFAASLVCFNGKADSGSSCRTTMAKIEGGLSVTTSKLTCGHPGAVSEITWTYRGRKGDIDLYHLVRRFSSDAPNANTTETDVNFTGARQILFQDAAQCILIELPKAGN